MARRSGVPTVNAIDRTWWLSDPIGVLQKFDWEYANAFDNHGNHIELRIAGYYAMNAAITAWSLIDWIASDLTESDSWERAAVLQANGKSVQSKATLQEYARTDAFMAAVEQIAIAAKHRTLNTGYKPGYRVTDDIAISDDGRIDRAMEVHLPDGVVDVRVVLDRAGDWIRDLLVALKY
jgi:hypothetical protein